MDRGKKPSSKLYGNLNCKMYLDLKDIIREYAIPFCPAKSLYRFMGVCRDWKNQISTPFFAHNQSINFHATSGLFCQSQGNPPSFISLDMKSYGVPDSSLKFLPEEIDILSSSNGLVCCQGRAGDKPYYICNPVTKQWKKLPKSNANHGPDPAIVLIFEPSLLNFVADYKLVCAFPSTDFDNGHEFEIYSSSRGSWEVSGEILFGNRTLIPKSGVHANGIVYWLTKHYGILAFDLMKERAQVISSYVSSTRDSSMGVIDGKLCMFSLSKSQVTVSVLANVHSNTMGTFGGSSSTAGMLGKGKTWEEMYRIPLDRLVAGGVSYDGATIVFGGSDMMVIMAGSTLISYDLKTKESAVLFSAAEYDMRAAEYDMRYTAYVNSLVYF